uniref:Uncharacterized protein n=1 Tax=Plectus sambesii TaxID=2011161 RepID=A0A914WYG4_9BILA
MSELIQADLRAAGVITSPEKCIWNPVQRLDWLDITIDLHQFQLEASTKRITLALNLIDSLLRTNCPSARDRMRIAGKLISMASVLGCIVQLKMRRLYEAINAVFPNINRQAVDAFASHCGGEVNWLCPPVSLIVQTIRHLSKCKAKGTLIVPEWPSQLYLALLRPNGLWAAFVKDVWQAAAANPALCPVTAQVQDLLRASKADRTETSYLAIITRFVAWRDSMLCSDSALDGPTAVAPFLAQEHARMSGKIEVA